jgi:hypothetical protein
MDWTRNDAVWTAYLGIRVHGIVTWRKLSRDMESQHYKIYDKILLCFIEVKEEHNRIDIFLL